MNTHVEINLDAIKNNWLEITKEYPEYSYFIAVIKGDAYGHGMYVAKQLEECRATYLAVSSLEEAIEARKYAFKTPILCLIPIPIERVGDALANKITLTITDYEYAKKLVSLNVKNVKVHLKLDTGMNRLGFKDKTEFMKTYIYLKRHKIMVEGLFTHFATIGMYDPYFDQQVAKFKELTSDLDLKEIPIVHVGSSVILLTHPKLDFCNGFRVGALLYGYNVAPSLNTHQPKDRLRLLKFNYYHHKNQLSEFHFNKKINVQPALSFVSYFVQIKEVKKGEHIGYGASYQATDDMIIGILPVGYNNGIGTNPNRYVLINNKKYFFVGGIGMNMSMVKIDESVTLKSPVYLVNQDLPITYTASVENTSFVYALLQIGKNNNRVYLKNKKIVYQSNRGEEYENV